MDVFEKRRRVDIRALESSRDRLFFTIYTV
jgi:hypothetical protein